LSLVSHFLVSYRVVTTDAPITLATIFDSRFDGRTVVISTTSLAFALALLTDIGVGSSQSNVGRSQKQQVQHCSALS
jgi:hypothetical protein